MLQKHRSGIYIPWLDEWLCAIQIMDDTALMAPSEEVIKQSLRYVTEWQGEYGQRVHTDPPKSAYLRWLITTASPILFGLSQLQNASEYKQCGYTWDSKLDSGAHIKTMIATANQEAQCIASLHMEGIVPLVQAACATQLNVMGMLAVAAPIWTSVAMHRRAVRSLQRSAAMKLLGVSDLPSITMVCDELQWMPWDLGLLVRAANWFVKVFTDKLCKHTSLAVRYDATLSDGRWSWNDAALQENDLPAKPRILLRVPNIDQAKAYARNCNRILKTRVADFIHGRKDGVEQKWIKLICDRGRAGVKCAQGPVRQHQNELMSYVAVVRFRLGIVPLGCIKHGSTSNVEWMCCMLCKQSGIIRLGHFKTCPALRDLAAVDNEIQKRCEMMDPYQWECFMLNYRHHEIAERSQVLQAIHSQIMMQSRETQVVHSSKIDKRTREKCTR